MGYPDLEARELCFRIYNEYLAELQERSGGRFYGVGLINWWDARRCGQRTLAELKSSGFATFWLPLKAGNGADGKADRLQQPAHDAGLGGGRGIGHPGVAPHRRRHRSRPLCARTATRSAWSTTQHPSARCSAATSAGGCSTGTRPCGSVGSREASTGCPRPSRTPSTCTPPTGTRSTSSWSTSPATTGTTTCTSAFMLDPLGLDLIDRIGIDKVMWSTDFPHIESTFGYSEKSLDGGRRQTRSPRRPHRWSAATCSTSSACRLERHSHRPGGSRPGPHAAGPLGPAAGRHGRAGRGRPGAARQQQRLLCHRSQLAARRPGSGQRRTTGGRRRRRTTSIRTSSPRRPRWPCR